MIQEESEKDLELEDELESNAASLMKKKFSDSNLPSKPQETEAAVAKISNSQTLPGNSKLRHRNSSPILKRRPQINPNATNMARRSSKTLPRGFSLANAAGDSLDCDVFGLYGELLNVRDYDCDSGERISMSDELRKSDPELSTIPYRLVKFEFEWFFLARTAIKLSMIGPNLLPPVSLDGAEKNLQCAEAKRGKILKAPPVFFLTF